MLPIVRRRALQIPHGLAAVSAAICLALAFSTDLAERKNQALADRPEVPVVQVVGAPEETLTDNSGLGEGRNNRRAMETAQPRPPTQLIPWFPGLRLGGE